MRIKTDARTEADQYIRTNATCDEDLLVLVDSIWNWNEAADAWCSRETPRFREVRGIFSDSAIAIDEHALVSKRANCELKTQLELLPNKLKANDPILCSAARAFVLVVSP
jgi:hypothetical protein